MRTQIVDMAQAAVQSVQAALTQAELNLSYCTVRSPIAGVSGRKRWSVGNLVGKGDATTLVTVSSANPIWMDFSASELAGGADEPDEIRSPPRKEPGRVGGKSQPVNEVGPRGRAGLNSPARHAPGY